MRLYREENGTLAPVEVPDKDVIGDAWQTYPSSIPDDKTVEYAWTTHWGGKQILYLAPKKAVKPLKRTEEPQSQADDEA